MKKQMHAVIRALTGEVINIGPWDYIIESAPVVLNEAGDVVQYGSWDWQTEEHEAVFDADHAIQIMGRWDHQLKPKTVVVNMRGREVDWPANAPLPPFLEHREIQVSTNPMPDGWTEGLTYVHRNPLPDGWTESVVDVVHNPLPDGAYEDEAEIVICEDGARYSMDRFAEVQRQKRNTLLKESDWTQGGDVKVDGAWRDYRSALRDITNLLEWPVIEFPHAPE